MRVWQWKSYIKVFVLQCSEKLRVLSISVHIWEFIYPFSLCDRVESRVDHQARVDVKVRCRGVGILETT